MLGRFPPFDIVVGCTLKKRGIGFGGQLPWHLPKDMAFFRDITKIGPETNVCIMGKSTFDSIGKALPGRHNIVLSKLSKITAKGVHQASSLQDALDLAKSLSARGRYFVIGGYKVFEYAIPDCRYIYETRINQEFKCDRYMPHHGFPAKFISKTFRYNGVNFDFCQFQNPKNTYIFHRDIPYGSHEEYQYVNMLKYILESGEDRMDRTKTGTRSLFGKMMRFDLSQSFPLLTTKKVFWRGVVEELLWFIKGSTNGNELKYKKVTIWDGNGSRQYLDSIGLNHREEGDLGPIYGFQWRHWNAPYVDMHTDYHGKGIDQLQNLIHDIKTNPQSRRLILSAWNPGQLKYMALPPCHIMCHFNVTNDSRLNCLMYQRSCDMGLGVPFNIASYSLLTCLIAQICDLKRGYFIHVLGDCHIYNDHIDMLKPYLDRQPFPFPFLKLNESIRNIDDFRVDDISLYGYVSHDKIKMRMAV